MKNIAKCKLCQSILESFHDQDYVSCKCGEIAIDGGTSKLLCYAKDFKNFLRIDDQGNEIIVKVVDDNAKPTEEAQDNPKPTIRDMLVMLDDMIANIERLPEHAMTTPVNHYDLSSALLLVSALFKAMACKDAI